MGKQKVIMLLITYKCNLRCSYCYEPKVSNFKMNAAKAKGIIREQIEALDDEYEVVEIQFMGGEPLLEFPLIKECAEWLWSTPITDKQMMLFAPTNGTLLTNDMKEWFAKNKDRIHLGLSFDGDMAMQNANRSSSFHNVDLDFFVKTWPNQSVKMTISPDTISNMADGVKFLHQIGFKYISADLAMGDSVGWTKEKLCIYQTELKKLIEFYLANHQLIPFSMLRVDVNTIMHPKTENHKTCSCGEDMVCVDWTGKMYACHLFSPVTISKEKAEKAAVTIDFKNHSCFNKGKCAKCILNMVCTHCYGMNYVCSDDINTPSPFHCSAFKLLFVANCRYQLQMAKRNEDDTAIQQINNVINKIV